jgi:hypothetical protein
MGTAVTRPQRLSQTGGLNLADADINRPPRPHSRSHVDPRPCGAVIPGVQEHPFAVKETAEAEMASMFEEVAADDAAMSEIAINIASNPVVTLKPAAIKIALTVEETSMPQIVAIMPSKLPAALVASNVAVPTLLIEERAALPRRTARHAAEVRGTGRPCDIPADRRMFRRMIRPPRR